MTIPKGYKQTELGIIPDDWEVKTFGELGSFSKGSGISRAESNTGNIPCVRYGEIYTHHNDYIKKYNSFISSEVAKKAKLLHCGDILFAGSGETKEDIGKSIAFIENIEAYAGGDIIILSTIANICDAKFIGYVSNTSFVNKQKATKGQGDAVVHITSDSLKNILILLPPLSEQQSIAEALSDVDNLIAALDKKIAKKRFIKQGAMQQLLTGKKRLPGFTDKWVERTLSQLGCFISGCGFPIRFQGNKSGELPFFKVSDFNNKDNDISLSNANNYISKVIKDKLNCNLIPRNSIIFAKIGAAIFLERKRLCDIDCCIDNNMMAFYPNNDVNANYICFLLQTISFGELVEATALPSLGSKIVGSIPLLIPNNRIEQQAIATILSDMDKEIADLETQRDKYRLIKSGMMQKLLTGEIRLRKE